MEWGRFNAGSPLSCFEVGGRQVVFWGEEEEVRCERDCESGGVGREKRLGRSGGVDR